MIQYETLCTIIMPQMKGFVKDEEELNKLSRIEQDILNVCATCIIKPIY